MPKRGREVVDVIVPLLPNQQGYGAYAPLFFSYYLDIWF